MQTTELHEERVTSHEEVRAAPSAETMDRIAYWATRAPSPHNAQGWSIVAADGAIEVRLDDERRVLRELDPSGKEGRIACGAAVANVAVAAHEEGLRAEIDWLPEGADSPLCARVRLHADGAPADRSLFEALRRRAVQRSPYRRTPIDPRTLDELRAVAKADGLRLSFVTERAQIEALAELATEAGRMKLAHGPTQRELHGMLRFDGKHAARTRDGLDLGLFFVPPMGARLASIAMRWQVIRALDAVGVTRVIAGSNEGALVRQAPALALLVAPSSTPHWFLRGGHAFQSIALHATARGLALQPHSAAVELALAHPKPLDASVPGAWHERIASIRRAMLAAFDVRDDAMPVVFFRIGEPTMQPKRRSLRRAAPMPSVRPRASDEFYDELVSRNRPAVSDDDQRLLRHTRFLFAGCGSIGGAPVETLVRMGATRLTLADPGSFEPNNLNRQSATLRDVGRNKAEVARERALAINPHAQVLVERAGVTADNVDYLVGSTDVVIDGVDVTESAGIRAKRQLHEEAWRQRRRVIVGLDLGGTQLLRVYDYRSDRSKALDGALDDVPLEASLGSRDFLTRILSPLDVPLEMVRYAESLLRGETLPAPQLAPTATLFGALAAWAALDVAAGRPVKREIAVDAPGLLMPRGRWLATQARRFAGFLRLKRLVREQL